MGQSRRGNGRESTHETREQMKAVSRFNELLLAGALALVPSAALAQQAPPPEAETPATDSIGPRDLQNFSLNGTVTRPADRLCVVGRAQWLLDEHDPLPPADAVLDVDEHALVAAGREQPLAPQLALLLEAIAEGGDEGVTAETLYHAVWRGEDYHALRHRNAVYVAVNRLRAALEPIGGHEALRSTATHYALAPGLRIAVCRAVRRLDIGGFAERAVDGDARGYARRHALPAAQARWELALHAAMRGVRAR